MDALYGLIAIIIFLFCGYKLGSSITKETYEKILKDEKRLSMKLLKSEYERGYRDGFMSKVTPNEIRKVIGLEPIKEVNNDLWKMSHM